MPKMTKAEREFLKQAKGPGEQAYHVKLDLKFLADPSMDFMEVHKRILKLVRGNLNKVTMPTKRLPTHYDIIRVEL